MLTNFYQHRTIFIENIAHFPCFYSWVFCVTYLFLKKKLTLKNKKFTHPGKGFYNAKVHDRHKYDILSTFLKIYGKCKFHGYSAVHTPVDGNLVGL